MERYVYGPPEVVILLDNYLFWIKSYTIKNLDTLYKFYSTKLNTAFYRQKKYLKLTEDFCRCFLDVTRTLNYLATIKTWTPSSVCLIT